MGIFGNLDRLKNMRSRNFGGEGGGGVRVIWRNPDLTGFSLMMASLKETSIISKLIFCVITHVVVLLPSAL